MRARVRSGLSIALVLMNGAALASTSAEDNFYASRPNGPRVVLVQGGTGSGSPSFALYGDRMAIFRAPAGVPAPSGYLSTRLTDTQHQALMASVAPEALLKLGDSYVALTEADPPRHLLHVWAEGRRKTISAFGDLRSARARERFPPELLRALGAITTFSAPAGNWLPSNIEVYHWPRTQSRGEPLPWPKDVPPSGYRIEMKDGLNGQIMVSSHFASLQRLIASLKPGQAVRIADRNWAVSYRLPFPYEDAWKERRGEHDIAQMPSRAPAGEPRGVAEPVAEPSVVFEVQGGRRGGPDTPVFALFADGLVIFRAPYESKVPSSYLSARLPEPRYKAVISSVAPGALLKLADSYDAITGTDPVTNVIHVWVNGRRKTVSVAGHLFQLPGGGDGRSKTPPEFLRAYDAITNFSAPASPWLPPAVELLLWPRERFQEEVVPWPQGWPSLEGAAISRGGMHRLSLPAGQFGRLKALLPDSGHGRTVRIEKQLWTIAYRLPFPHEALWAR